MKKNCVSSVLELGCNQGANLTYVAREHPDIKKMVGIDICENAIKYGLEIEKNKADLQIGSIYDLSRFDDDSFDVVFTRGTLLHIPEERFCDVLTEMIRVAKNFIFHIEYDGKTAVRGTSGAGHLVDGKKVSVPHSFIHDFRKAYGKLEKTAYVKDIKACTNYGAVGGVNHFIYVNLEKEIII